MTLHSNQLKSAKGAYQGLSKSNFSGTEYMNFIKDDLEGQPVNAPHNVMIQIFRAYRWMTKSCINMMKGLGYDTLEAPDYAAITVLDSGNITVIELARRLNCPVPEALDQVNKLESLGYIKLVRDKNLDNQKQIIFTESGWELINDLSNATTQVEIVLGQRIGTPALNTFRSIFAMDWGYSLTESELIHNEQLPNQENNKLDL